MSFSPRKNFERQGVISVLLLLIPAIAFAQDNAPGAYTDLETKYIFGFTEGSDIGPEGERAIEFDSNFEFQRRFGSYNALEQEIEYETNPTPDLQIEASAHGVYHQIQSVPGFDNFSGINFGGLSTNIRYNVIGRGPGAPIGLTLSIEPEWARVDDGGKVVTDFGATAKILVDTELVPDRLFAAFNAIYAPELIRDFGSPDWAKADTLGLTTALSYRIAPNVTIKNHRFQPSELKAPANRPITLTVRNLDPTPEEFESLTLRVEKVVAGNSEITIQLRPLSPGRYRFYGDFNQATAQGALTAE